jgi:hypothetical protein
MQMSGIVGSFLLIWLLYIDQMCLVKFQILQETKHAHAHRMKKGAQCQHNILCIKWCRWRTKGIDTCTQCGMENISEQSLDAPIRDQLGHFSQATKLTMESRRNV